MIGSNNKSVLHFVIVFGLVCFVSMLHYLTRQEDTILHVIYRELYFLPIILAGFWFGLRGGLITALVITALYAPLISEKSSGLASHDLGNLLEILLFNTVGILIGWLRDREMMQQEMRKKRRRAGWHGKGRCMCCP